MMETIIDEKLTDLINNKASIKILATTDPDGNPHVVLKGTLHVNSDGMIEYWELIESSQTNKNMVHSIWFEKQVAINVLYDNESYQIKGIPYRALIHGHEFEERYRTVKRDKGVDLSTVWLIKPVEVREETFAARLNFEKEEHPILGHLDWIVKEES